MGNMNKNFGMILTLILSAVVLSILSVVLGGTAILGSATLGSFTGFVSVVTLIPLIGAAIIIWREWRGAGGG